MTEDEYTHASDLAQLRVAKEILKECYTFQGEKIKEAFLLVAQRIDEMFDQIEIKEKPDD